jgi:homogentisate 1,2-dioxygenase
MPFYHRLGKLPHKRHTVFRRPDGQLYREHLMGSEGFTGPASLLYHNRPPTRVLATKHLRSLAIEADPDPALRMRHFHLSQIGPAQSMALDRTPVLFNADVTLSLVCPSQSDTFFYRNGQGDELTFVSDGGGVLESEFGELTFRRGDYVLVPRGIVHQWRLDAGPVRLLVMETPSTIRPPRRYRGETGQFLEHSPYCERDIRPPERLVTHDEAGEFRLIVKQRDALTEVLLDHHPFDVVGWDGHYFPWAFSIHDFAPIVGALHQPPPVHQTFQADRFVVCSFTPRLFDFHPDAIPAPYNHSNVMSDEVIYYANDEFMSRKGIGYGSLTLHPGGLPHGPHPGRAEASIGAKSTNELAVMLDTFRPLLVARAALATEDAEYGRSWLE